MFPFALQLAPAVACRRRLRAGVAVVGLFAGIRWRQDAPAHVLRWRLAAVVPALAAAAVGRLGLLL